MPAHARDEDPRAYAADHRVEAEHEQQSCRSAM